MRFCSKTACDRAAAVSCAFDYGARLVWLSELGDESHPATYELCEEHAESLRVPRGWEMEDRRPVLGMSAEASAFVPPQPVDRGEDASEAPGPNLELPAAGDRDPTRAAAARPAGSVRLETRYRVADTAKVPSPASAAEPFPAQASLLG